MLNWSAITVRISTEKFFLSYLAHQASNQTGQWMFSSTKVKLFVSLPQCFVSLADERTTPESDVMQHCLRNSSPVILWDNVIFPVRRAVLITDHEQIKRSPANRAQCFEHVGIRSVRLITSNDLSSKRQLLRVGVQKVSHICLASFVMSEGHFKHGIRMCVS